MSFAKKFNTSKAIFDFKVPENHPFKKPSQLVEENGIDMVYKLNLCYINKKGLFGNEPVLITDNESVNAPTYIAKTVEEIVKDEEAVKQINDGKVGFKFYQYQNKFGEQIGIEWVDL